MKIKLFLLSFLMSAVSFANDAGCGLGSMVMGKNSKVSQILAITTNGTFSNQLLGVISGTSGCSASAIVKYKAEAIKVAETNFESLKMDMARGEGEALSSIGSIFGCHSKSLQQFSKFSQKNFSEIVSPQSTPTQVIESLDSKLRNDAQLNSLCVVES